MHTTQPRPATNLKMIIALVLFILALGVGCALLISSLTIQHNLIPLSSYVSFWAGIFLFVYSRWRQPHQRRLVWISALALGMLWIIIAAGFIWYPPLALALLGSFLALAVVVLFAQWTKPSSAAGWLLLSGYGLLGGAAAALLFWFMLGPGVTNLPMLLLVVLTAGLAALAGGALRHTSEAIWHCFRRGRARDTAEQTPAAASAPISRRDVLLGLGGLAGLAVTGVSFTWLSRSLLAHAFPLVTYTGLGTIRSLSWSPDGKWIISSSGEKYQGGVITIWDANTGKERLSYKDAWKEGYDAVQAVAWSPDGKRIALGGQSGLLLFNQPSVNAAIIDAATLRPIITFSAGKPDSLFGVNSVGWSPDSTRIVIDADQVQILDATTGKQLLSIDAKAILVAWSPDGQYVVTGEETAQIWDATSGALLTTYRGHTTFVHTVAWSPDSTKVASGSLDDTVQVWEAQTGRHLLTYHAEFDTTVVAWSPDGTRIASAGIGGDVHVWNATTGGLVFLYKGHSQEVNALAWSPDGTRIASGSDDETVQVWQPG